MIYLIAIMVFICMACCIYAAWHIKGIALDVSMIRLTRRGS